MSITPDYAERVYAGILGKMIGVYLGRPIEGWRYENIIKRLGEINYYVHDKLNVPLIVTDDDLSGTFTFVRALADYDYRRDLTPAQIGQTWLNYVVEGKTILWWGGIGDVTEHTAYLRLKHGIPAPQSGSIELNGATMAQQIGSQIFIDGWAMVVPGDPEFAADLARRAASVSHDGEAIYAAQVVAAIEAQAFVEPDINKLIDTAVSLIPADSVIYRMIADLREWHQREPDWHKTRQQIADVYGYDNYEGNCHIVPNHALIIFALLYGDDHFQKSLMIVNTSGWDTDCNSGNVGCIMGIKNGLAGIEQGPDWRSPVADRLYLPTADGGSAITDAVQETYKIVNTGRALAFLTPLAPKNGARYHFSLPGSVQGFESDFISDSRGAAAVENVIGHSESGERSLAIRFQQLAVGRPARITTPTFIPSKAIADYFDQRGYRLLASPTLYPGQTVTARLSADVGNPGSVGVCLYARHYNEDDDLERIHSEPVQIAAGTNVNLFWIIPDTSGQPIASIGIEIIGENGISGTLYLDYLTWEGTPTMTLNRPPISDASPEGLRKYPVFWKKAWIHTLDSDERLNQRDYWQESYRLIQNEGRGMLIQGTRDWTDYQFSAVARPRVCKVGGIAVRVQGLQRYYALLLDRQNARLVRMLDGETVLASVTVGWEFEHSYDLQLQVIGSHIVGFIDGRKLLEADDDRLQSGGIALVDEEGFIYFNDVAISPI